MNDAQNDCLYILNCDFMFVYKIVYPVSFHPTSAPYLSLVRWIIVFRRSCLVTRRTPFQIIVDEMIRINGMAVC